MIRCKDCGAIKADLTGLSTWTGERRDSSGICWHRNYETLCSACGGVGSVEGSAMKPCPACAGSGAEMARPVQALIVETCRSIEKLLLEKNAAYGNSALDPLRVFSKASSIEQILVRIDDKLSRLSRGAAAGEDVEQDLLGYLVLLRVARRMAATAPATEIVTPAAVTLEVRNRLPPLGSLWCKRFLGGAPTDTQSYRVVTRTDIAIELEGENGKPWHVRATEWPGEWIEARQWLKVDS